MIARDNAINKSSRFQAMRRYLRLALFHILALAIGVSVVPVSSFATAYHRKTSPLKPLRQWLLRTGKVTVVRGRILEPMNLPAVDMPVRERGFRHKGERLTHVCSVSTMFGYQDVLFFAQVDESDGSATIWRTGQDGTLVSTVRFSRGGVERIPNKRFNSDFVAEKLFFTTQMRVQPAL